MGCAAPSRPSRGKVTRLGTPLKMGAAVAAMGAAVAAMGAAVAAGVTRAMRSGRGVGTAPTPSCDVNIEPITNSALQHRDFIFIPRGRTEEQLQKACLRSH